MAVITAGCSISENVPFLDKDQKNTAEEKQNVREQEKSSQSKEPNNREAQAGSVNKDNSPAGESDVLLNKPGTAEKKEGPKLTLNLPEKMTTTYNKLKVSGVTGSQCTVFVNGQSLRLRSDGSFNTEITLRPGINEIEVISVDTSGASTTVQREVIFNADKPLLQVFSPQESTSAHISISGYTDPGCIVYINNNKVKTDANGSFSGTVEIKNKGENTVNVVAVNSYGVSSRVTKIVRGVPPRIEVAAPEVTTQNKVTISGVTDANSTVVVLVGSDEVQVDNSDGTFSLELDLEPGINDFTVLAANIFGTTEKQVTILYDDFNNYFK
ncbi:MAG: hypothetical protein H0Z40_00805 [Desulfotomaculum sp.]|nr:hypothetical protein [Desulfotomaculum sp.]